MARVIDLKDVVARRSRDIAQAAHERAVGADDRAQRFTATTDEPAPEAPAWLRRVADWLPDPIRLSLRAALRDEDEQRRLRGLAERIGREKEALQHQTTALDAARTELYQAQKSLELGRRELTALEKVARQRQAEAEQILARAQRAARLTAVERRVPVSAIDWDASASPRPLRGVGRLTANIKRYGQLTPIAVTAIDPLDEGGRFTLITGYRRMAALEAAGCTHALVRVVPALDDETVAALQIAENCMVDGVSANAVRHLEDHLSELLEEGAPLLAVARQILADDEAVIEDVFLDDMAEEALHHLAEGAAWVAELRPYWADLDDARAPLEDLIVYFARVAARLKRA